MKCSNCGNELIPGAKFCGKCGHPVQLTVINQCPNCGAAIDPNAKFCGKCGYLINQQPRKAFCIHCGSELAPNAKFCSACGTPVDGSGGKVGSIVNNLNISAHLEVVKRKLREFYSAVNKKVGNVKISNEKTDASKLQRLLTILVIIGICVTCFGIFGKIMKNVIKDELRLSLGEYRFVINTDDIWTLASCIVRGDNKGATNVVNRFSRYIDLFDLDVSGSDVADFISPMLFTVRSIIKDEMGNSWYLLFTVILAESLLIPGIILTAASTAGLYLSGGSLAYLKDHSYTPLLIGMGIWIVLLVIFSIVGSSAIKSIDTSEIYDFFESVFY